MKNKPYKIKGKCSVCKKHLRIARVEEKDTVVGICENKKCESMVVFGEPIQEMLRRAAEKNGEQT